MINMLDFILEILEFAFAIYAFTYQNNPQHKKYKKKNKRKKIKNQTEQHRLGSSFSYILYSLIYKKVKLIKIF